MYFKQTKRQQDNTLLVHLPNPYKITPIKCFDSIISKFNFFFLVSSPPAVVDFNPKVHRQLEESTNHNRSNDCSDTDFVLNVFDYAHSSHCSSHVLCPATFSQTNTYSFTSRMLMFSFIGQVPRQPRMGSAVSSVSPLLRPGG